MIHETRGKTDKIQIVILGGGFAGIETARYLDEQQSFEFFIKVIFCLWLSITNRELSCPYGLSRPKWVC